MAQRKFEGVWIPAHIWLDQSLSITEKCLLFEVNSLDIDPDRACFASNEYLGKFLGLSAGRVANMVSDLRKRGYIEQVYFDGRNRGLRVPMLHEIGKNLHENVKAGFTKTGKQPSRKREQNSIVNNTNEEREESAPALPDFSVKARDTKAIIGNPDAYKTASETFKTLATARRAEYPEKFLSPYFLFQQQKGRWYELAAPADDGDAQKWFGEHYAGLQAWALRQPQFEKQAAPADGLRISLKH